MTDVGACIYHVLRKVGMNFPAVLTCVPRLTSTIHRVAISYFLIQPVKNS